MLPDVPVTDGTPPGHQVPAYKQHSKNCVNCDNSFEVKVRLHQGSVLSPLLFIMVLEAHSRVSPRVAMGALLR